MKEITSREKILLTAAAIAIMFYMYNFYYLPYFNNRIKETQASIEKYKSGISDLKTYGENVQGNLESMERSLPNNEDDFYVINSVETVCNNNNILLNKVAFKKSFAADNTLGEVKNTSMGRLYALPVSIYVSGNYIDISNFIYSIENCERASEIQSLEIKSSNKDFLVHADILYYYINFEIEDDKSYELNDVTVENDEGI